MQGRRDWEYGLSGEWSYARCDGCRILQLDPLPITEDLMAAYGNECEPYRHSERTGLIFGQLKRVVDSAWLRRLRRIVSSRDRVLDVECGEGGYAVPLGGNWSHSVWAGLQSPCCRASQGVRVPSLCKHVRGIRGSRAIHSVRLGAVKDYLEHSLDPRGDLALARQSIVDGGRIIITVPNFDAFDRLLFGRYWGGNHAPRHTFQFTPDSLAALLRQSAFEVLSVKSGSSPTPFALSVKNLLQRREVLAGNKPPLSGGRMRYYTAFLLMFAPIQLLLLPTRRVGFMVLMARATKVSS